MPRDEISIKPDRLNLIPNFVHENGMRDKTRRALASDPEWGGPRQILLSIEDLTVKLALTSSTFQSQHASPLTYNIRSRNAQGAGVCLKVRGV